jgi:hypothetical protein
LDKEFEDKSYKNKSDRLDFKVFTKEANKATKQLFCPK